MSHVGLDPGHIAEHWSDSGMCQCPCSDCTLRTTKGCVCLDCPCIASADHDPEGVERIAVPLSIWLWRRKW